MSTYEEWADQLRKQTAAAIAQLPEPRWVRCSDRLPGDEREYRARHGDGGEEWRLRWIDGVLRLSAPRNSEYLLKYWARAHGHFSWLDEAPAQEGQRESDRKSRGLPEPTGPSTRDADFHPMPEGRTNLGELLHRAIKERPWEGQRQAAQELPASPLSSNGKDPVSHSDGKPAVPVPGQAVAREKRKETEAQLPVQSSMPPNYISQSQRRAQAVREVQTMGVAFRKEYGNGRRY